MRVSRRTGQASNGKPGSWTLAAANIEVMDCGSTVLDTQWRQYLCSFSSGAHLSLRTYIGDGGGHHFFDDFEVY